MGASPIKRGLYHPFWQSATGASSKNPNEVGQSISKPLEGGRSTVVSPPIIRPPSTVQDMHAHLHSVDRQLGICTKVLERDIAGGIDAAVITLLALQWQVRSVLQLLKERAPTAPATLSARPSKGLT